MSYHTAVVVVLCSIIALAAWIAWLWRPPGRVARKLQPIRDLSRRNLWEHKSSTIKTEQKPEPEPHEAEPEPQSDETQEMPLSYPPPEFPPRDAA